MSRYVTTAISYVNAAPHLGHALELVFTDAIARGARAAGEDVRLLTGTDENSLKNVRAAEDEGLAPQAFVDRNAALFAALARRLDVSHDDFIRTTEARHAAGVEAIWRACEARGDFYRARYRGLYCVGCEQFYTPDELDGGLCPEHGRAPEEIEEENVFFRLSRYQRAIEIVIESGALRIVPQAAHNEALAFVRRGLADFSVSRSRNRARGWGIAVPGDPSQIIYVWFDALASYVTALDPAQYARYWEGARERVHVIGKGITRFHAVYWPGILLSAGLPLPTKLIVHGYLTAGGRKIGKSLGNVVDPHALADRFGTDALRYWLLRHVRPTSDADFQEAHLARAYDQELADQLGNLVQRTAAAIERWCAGVVPGAGAEGDDLRAASARLEAVVRGHLEDTRPDRALAAIFDHVAAANAFVERAAPWTLARGRDVRLEPVLGALAEALRVIGRALDPFLPETAARIRARIGGDRITAGAPLFPRLDARWRAARRR